MSKNNAIALFGGTITVVLMGGAIYVSTQGQDSSLYWFFAAMVGLFTLGAIVA